jgi:surfeit locus 1 family protein
VSREPADADRAGRPRTALALAAIGGMLLVFFSGFVALGVWQVQRLHWKRELIARVDHRIHAEPVAAPVSGDWPNVGAERDEYRRVFVEGIYLRGHDTRVQALTELGAGDWVLTPLRTADGEIVLVNRGFVPSTIASRAVPLPEGLVHVTGLLRITEPKGAFLRPNDAAHDRWHSRDVGAIASARGLSSVAPYFIDAERGTASPGSQWPTAGLTVVQFPNNHLMYAVTWFSLAALVAFAALQLVSAERRLRHDAASLAAGRDADAGILLLRD